LKVYAKCLDGQDEIARRRGQGPISAAEWVVHLTHAYSNRCDLQERLQDALRKLARSGEGFSAQP